MFVSYLISIGYKYIKILLKRGGNRYIINVSKGQATAKSGGQSKRVYIVYIMCGGFVKR